MNFKSQICTTREQSERLLALGLKQETADMSIPIKDNPNLYCSADRTMIGMVIGNIIDSLFLHGVLVGYWK